jgi:hypothetical protein
MYKHQKTFWYNLSFDLMKKNKKNSQAGLEPGAAEWQNRTLPLDH